MQKRYNREIMNGYKIENPQACPDFPTACIQSSKRTRGFPYVSRHLREHTNRYNLFSLWRLKPDIAAFSKTHTTMFRCQSVFAVATHYGYRVHTPAFSWGLLRLMLLGTVNVVELWLISVDLFYLPSKGQVLLRSDFELRPIT
jgi:hypothetical protein